MMINLQRMFETSSVLNVLKTFYSVNKHPTEKSSMNDVECFDNIDEITLNKCSVKVKNV